MKDIIGWLGVIALSLVRIPLVLIGLPAVALSLVGGGIRRTPKMWKFWADAEDTPPSHAGSAWDKWVYWAVRNPTRGLRFEQPRPEPVANPDWQVRTGREVSSHRYMSGYQPEYWYLRKIGSKFFEFRIGWKYTTGGHIKFAPTFQLRLGG